VFIDREITIKLLPREDGGVRVCSDDVPGLILSGPDPLKVLADIGPALKILFHYRKNRGVEATQ
jgi:hypothetical protein